MQRVRQFLEQILQYSFLSKREKAEWQEEMESHINSSAFSLKEKEGMGEEEAVKKAITKFGDPEQLRKQITKEMFGLDIKLIGIISACFLILFIFSAIALPSLRVLSPSLMLALLLGVVTLIKTRKRIDRILIPVAFTPFIIAYLTNILFPHETFNWYLSFSITYWYPMNLFGAIFLALFGLGLYFVSRNQFISLLPLIFSVCYNVWHLVRHSIKFLYWSATDSPIIAKFGFGFLSTTADKQLIDLLIRLLMIVFLITIIQVFNRYVIRKASPVI